MRKLPEKLVKKVPAAETDSRHRFQPTLWQAQNNRFLMQWPRSTKAVKELRLKLLFFEMFLLFYIKPDLKLKSNQLQLKKLLPKYETIQCLKRVQKSLRSMQ